MDHFGENTCPGGSNGHIGKLNLRLTDGSILYCNIKRRSEFPS